MLSVSQVSVHFGGRTLFSDISFLINSGDRVGLTGKNGAGKSTLLKIIAGYQPPDDGEIAKSPGITIGYLPQEMVHHDGKTVFREAESAFSEIKQLENLISKFTHEMSARTDYESEGYMQLINRLNEANEKFNFMGGFNIEGEIEKILLGLGFSRDDFSRDTAEFSGGWRMRIELGKILLRKPDVILLDEPTNHLDIESIQWLEQFLKNYKGAIILVSHDRAFLDIVTNRTIEISLGRIFDYKASYSQYIQLREERKATQAATQENQQKKLQETREFIERFRYKATKAKQVQSRIKQLGKMDLVEVDEDDLSSINFYFPDAARSGKIVMEVNNLSKAYGDNLVLDNVNFNIERGDKIAFVGKNGEGKSTFSRIIAGKENYKGELKHGHNVSLGYFAQNQAEKLESDKTAFEVIDEAARGDTRAKVRNLLGAFLFSGEDAFKKVKVLSGGEKSRLALAKLLIEPVNLLILDEPTNHLDMQSKYMLKQALLQFNGTLVVVSHDRDFLKGLTTKVVEFSNKKLKEYPGDIYEYLRDRNIENLKELDIQSRSSRNVPAAESKKNQKENWEARKEQEREEKRLRKKIEQCEKNIAKMEARIHDMEKDMSSAEFLHIQTQEYFQQYDKIKKQLEDEMIQWEELSLQLEEMR